MFSSSFGSTPGDNGELALDQTQASNDEEGTVEKHLPDLDPMLLTGDAEFNDELDAMD